MVEVQVTEASGTAERSSALTMIEQIADEAHCTVAADKAYDTRGFVDQMRQINATPHVAQNIDRSGGSAIDGRTTRHAGYALSLRARKLIEEAFGWGKDIGLLRRPKFRGRHKIEYATLLTFTGYNLVRMRHLWRQVSGDSKMNTDNAMQSESYEHLIEPRQINVSAAVNESLTDNSSDARSAASAFRPLKLAFSTPC